MSTEKQFREKDIEDLERTNKLLGDMAQRLSVDGHEGIASNLRANIASLKTSITIIKKRYDIHTAPEFDDDIPF